MATSVPLDRGFGRPARAEPIPAVADIAKLSDAELIEMIAAEEEEMEARG